MERAARPARAVEEAEAEGDWDEESEGAVEDGEGPAGEPAEDGEWEETPEDDDAGAEDEEDRK